MYCVYDTTDKIIAFHDDIDVVTTYVTNIKKSNSDHPDLKIGKIKKKKVKSTIDFDDLYLVRYGDTYIQSKYIMYGELLSGQCIYDNQHCRDTLLRILECDDITPKERKTIERTVKIIDRILQNDKEYTPTIQLLKTCEMDYAQYMNHRESY